MKFTLLPAIEIGNKFQNRPIREHTVLSIMETVPTMGWLQPIAVMHVSGVYECIYGFHRREAAKRLKCNVPCMVCPEGLTRPQIIERQMLENVARSQMTLSELADNLLMYIDDTKLTATAAGQKLGLKPSEVSNIRTCHTHLDPRVMLELSKAKIGHSIAAELAKVSHEKQLELLPFVLDGSLTRAELAKRVRNPKAPSLRITLPAPDSYDAYIAQLHDRIAKAKALQRQQIPFDLARKTFG